jgi:hypothetical protein
LTIFIQEALLQIQFQAELNFVDNGYLTLGQLHVVFVVDCWIVPKERYGSTLVDPHQQDAPNTIKYIAVECPEDHGHIQASN